jgi:phosphatidylglycerol---prolipoprotein diacylglyceryl transferase
MKKIEFTEFERKKYFDLYLYGGMLLVFIIMIMLAVIPQDGTPYNNVALDIGFAQIAWYAAFILTGIVLGAAQSHFEFKRVGMHPDHLYDALLLTVPIAILGSRLYYVIFDPTPNYNSLIDVINITQGGLSIHGAVITALIVVLIFTRVRKLNFWLMIDITAPGFFIGQIVGRWGNFMNQEAYGPVIQSEWVVNILPSFIREQMLIAGSYHHPTFLYEGLWNFVGLILLLIIRRKRWFKVGDMIGLYLIWYGLGRGAIIEPLRTQGAPGDSLRIWGFAVNIYLSLILFMVGGVLLIVLKRRYLKEQPYYVDTFYLTEGEQDEHQNDSV